jgi:hypothetical protein
MIELLARVCSEAVLVGNGDSIQSSLEPKLQGAARSFRCSPFPSESFVQLSRAGSVGSWLVTSPRWSRSSSRVRFLNPPETIERLIGIPGSAQRSVLAAWIYNTDPITTRPHASSRRATFPSADRPSRLTVG